ncbi:MAG: response regulator [Pseudomonadota bacterium]
MKVLWVEDHPNACKMLAAAGAAATHARLNVDLVIAESLLAAENRLRLERFDLVVVDLRLPDSVDEDATMTRIATMGDFRVAVVSASERRQELVDALVQSGRNCAKTAVAKEDLRLADFSSDPQSFVDFLKKMLNEESAAA